MGSNLCHAPASNVDTDRNSDNQKIYLCSFFRSKLWRLEDVFFLCYLVVLFLSCPSMMGASCIQLFLVVFIAIHTHTVRGSVAEWFHQVALLVAELRSRVYDVIFIGQICSGHVPFTQKMMLWQQLFQLWVDCARVATFFEDLPLCILQIIYRP